jgi:prophage tail gpP-like protein
MPNVGDLTSKLLGNAKGIPDDTLKLSVNGKFYQGWQGISVKRSIKCISGAFELTVVDRWSEEQKTWGINPGDECKVLIGSETIITGYVDTVAPSLSKDSKGFSVSGRDKTGDLVDCSLDLQQSSIANISLLGLAKKLGAPFGISAKQTLSSGLVNSKFKLQTGESAFEALDRAAKYNAVLVMNDGQGNILITRAGTSRASSDLVQGQNILSIEASFSMKERFSKYTVKTQDGDFETGQPDFAVKGVAFDKGVKRNRPIIIQSESAVSPALCVQRAKWEAAVRLGKSVSIHVTIPGWRQGNGSLWAINQIVMLKAPGVGVVGELLISEVDFNKSDSGTTTKLHLEPVSAYTPDPTIKDKWRELVQLESKKK